MDFSSSISINKMQPQIQIFFLLFFFLVGFASAGNLQNPDFESPPKNVSSDSSNPFVTLNENNTIPGWTFQGTVSYVTASPNISLPDNGHAIQLGEDGKINQTFNAGADFMNYILTFTLIPGGQNCSANANLLVSGSDTQGIFSFKQHYGKEAWQSYGLFLGLGGSSYNLEFTLGDANDACEGDFIVQVQAGPVVQNFTVRSNGTGSAQKSSLKFDAAGSRATPISFLSYTTIQTKDGILCGPVIDDVVLLSSGGSRMVIKLNVLISLLLFLILVL
ncbi:hypothetical protein CCACVL1_10239 [Corchorus capsularis]|uniref:DUF642 domain-containing protein n=1 Tax=Corchorus capsularis TaxID=210143 RepID=A0A1R3IRZ2_COCAP|nr:hypothetical protein CCACVL1_10239 [Corchorus capsularis]